MKKLVKPSKKQIATVVAYGGDNCGVGGCSLQIGNLVKTEYGGIVTIEFPHIHKFQKEYICI